MTIPGIWTEGNEGWKLSRPEGFPDERTLHGLIEAAPDMLPLAGAPRLVILGSEVRLGSGYADLLGVEASGRPVVIEIKLACNPEARRAVVSQLLGYAASLHGTAASQLENNQLRRSLDSAGHATILDAVIASDQEGAFDQAEFTAALDDHLSEGRFRLVFVLDEVPQELMTLVAYLEHVTDKLVIDLVAVSAFEVNGASIMIPQRVTPERYESESIAGITGDRSGTSASPRPTGTLYKGGDEFESSIQRISEEDRVKLHRLLDWARGLERKGIIDLGTYRGGAAGETVSLLPRLQSENAGLVTGWNDSGRASVSFWRSVFERKAPSFIARMENMIGGPIGQGTITRDISNDLLELLTEAYKEATKPADAGD